MFSLSLIDHDSFSSLSFYFSFHELIQNTTMNDDCFFFVFVVWLLPNNEEALCKLCVCVCMIFTHCRRCCHISVVVVFADNAEYDDDDDDDDTLTELTKKKTTKNKSKEEELFTIRAICHSNPSHYDWCLKKLFSFF